MILWNMWANVIIGSGEAVVIDGESLDTATSVEKKSCKGIYNKFKFFNRMVLF